MNVAADVNVHLENKRVSRGFFVFLWLMYSTVYMTKNCFSGALAAIVDEGIFTLAQTTLISSVFYAVYAPLQIIGGMLADKINPEKLITAGLVGGAVCNTVIFFNQSYAVMLVSWGFNAAVQLGIWPAVFKIMSSQLVRSDRRGMVFYMSFATSGGLLMSYAVSAFLTDWRYNFLISAVILLLDAIVLQAVYAKLKPLLIKDREVSSAQKAEGADAGSEKGYSAVKVFLLGGFFTIIPAVLLKTMVENGSKTLTPTILLQSYESVSPKIGNLLNILVIAAGVLGILFVKFLLFPRLIKNECLAILLLFAVSLPFVVLLRTVGSIPIWLAVLSFCMISTALSGTALLVNYYTMNFVFFGKNGTAAGIINASASLGLLLQYLVFGRVAQALGWTVVMLSWIVMVSVSIVCVAITVKPLSRLKRLQTK